MLKLCLALVFIALSGCSTSGTVAGNEAGSSPINPAEELEYKKAITRCYKTGGSRVVKIMGELRCY
jgi:hypothetical protein